MEAIQNGDTISLKARRPDEHLGLWGLCIDGYSMFCDLEALRRRMPEGFRRDGESERSESSIIREVIVLKLARYLS